jgi:hypothetical protein
LEIWIPYGDVESLVTLQAENLGELIDPAPEGHIDELAQLLVEKMKGYQKLVICDFKPATLKLLKALSPLVPQDGTMAIVSAFTRELESRVPELRGRVTKLSAPSVSLSREGEEEVKVAPELVDGTKFVLSTGEPDPLYGYLDARVALSISAMDGARKAAYLHREVDEPMSLEETKAYATTIALVEGVREATYATVITRGGEPYAIIDGGAKDARTHFPQQQVNPAKGIVVGAGGHGYDDTFSHTVRQAVGALKALRKGGEMLVVGECREGIGSDALQMQAIGRISESAARKGMYVDGMEEIGYLSRLKENYSITLLSSLPDLYAGNRFRFKTARSSADALQKVFHGTGRGAKLHVITRAPETSLAA